MSHKTESHLPPQRVLVACSDLMTASNLQARSQLDPEMIRTEAQALELVAADPHVYMVVVVDLQTMPELPRLLREDAHYGGSIIAFAPHVRTDLIDAARPWVTKVVARGAVIQRFDSLVSRAGGMRVPDPN